MPAFPPNASLDQIADAVHENARNHGFHDDPNLELFLERHLNLLHDEISELHDAIRSGKAHNLCDKANKMKDLGLIPVTNLEEEYADIVIRVLDQCRRLGIDIARAVATKHAYNVTRPHMHGKKF